MALLVKRYQVAYTLKTLATHQNADLRGVGAIGTITVLNNPLLPVHEFFTAGRVFPVRLRHGNLHSSDDAALDVRSVSLKFADSDFESPFDLMMQTSEKAAFWNIFTFDKMLTALKEGGKALEEYCLENPWQ